MGRYSCEDNGVQSGCPPYIESESCSEKEACVAGPPEKWLPQVVHTQAHLLIGRLHMTVRPAGLWLLPTSVDYLNPSIGYCPLSHPGYAPFLLDPAAGACALEGPNTSKPQESSGVHHPLCQMPNFPNTCLIFPLYSMFPSPCACSRHWCLPQHYYGEARHHPGYGVQSCRSASLHYAELWLDMSWSRRLV